MEELIKTWDGESVITRYDKQTGTWMFIAIHSTALGTATGGTRMKSYPRPDAALQDAMRLAEGMTYKWAGIDFPCGGGKAVLALSQELKDDARTALISRYGNWLSDLGGVFETGPDLGTAPVDMDIIRKQYPGVFGCTPEAGGRGDPGPYTALGVFSGIQASCKYVFGTNELSNRTVLVQGLGSVGAPLTGYLLEAGCNVCITDVNKERIDSLQSEHDVEVIDPEAVHKQPCDVFAPCATGGILGSETIPELECAIVAGGANNQLAVPEDAERLRNRDILYAPDFIINAGGALYLLALESMGWTLEQVREAILGFGETLTKIYTAADQSGIDTARAAEHLAKERIRSHRRAQGLEVGD
jgi:leucine dehydrogenase